MHHTATTRFLLLQPDDNAALRSLVASQRLQRAIGVVYRPDTERRSRFFDVRLTKQFDAVIHIYDTAAVKPLDKARCGSTTRRRKRFRQVFSHLGSAMKNSVIEVHDMLSVLTVDELDKRIGRVPGVDSDTVDYAAANATVRYDETRLEVGDIRVLMHQREPRNVLI